MLIRCVVLILFATGCPNLPTASELGEPQILALVAEPPCIQPGGSAHLDALVAGPSGTLVPSRIAWSVPTGSVRAIEASNVRAAVDASPGALIEVDAAVEVDGGAVLRGFRTLTVGVCANPVLAGITIDGVPAPGSSALTMVASTSVDLDVSIDGGVAAAEPVVSWFTTAGAIRLYRHTPTELVVRDAPGTGALYVIYRDGNGGVAWLERDVQITSR
jgi:hypothetical protein